MSASIAKGSDRGTNEISVLISASLLSADLARLADAVALVQDSADYIHCDVMDGHFVPNLTFGAPMVAAVKRISRKPLDVHLMIDNPGKWVVRYLAAGLDADDYLTIHCEADADSAGTLARIRDGGVRPGLAIKPGTSFSAVLPLLPLADQILIMTVEPGFGGQSFMRDMVSKIAECATLIRKDQVIAVDGGIDIGTAATVYCAGARLLAAGSAIFGSPNPIAAIAAIRKAAVARSQT